MLERYKVLAAVLKMGDRPFTARDVSNVSGVKETTVRTVLGRDKEFIESSERLRTMSRGGQPNIYRLKPEQEDVLRELVAAVAQVAEPRERVASRSAVVPTALLAAEEALLRIGADEDDDSRQAELELAAIALYEAHRAAEQAEVGAREAIVTHAVAVDALRELAEMESRGLREPSQVEALRQKLQQVATFLDPLDPELLAKVHERVNASAIAAEIATPVEPVVEVVALERDEREWSTLVRRVFGAADLNVCVRDELTDTPASEVTVSILIVNGAELAGSSLLSRFVSRRPHSYRLVLDVDVMNPSLAAAAWAGSTPYLSRESANEASLSGAIRMLMGSERGRPASPRQLTPTRQLARSQGFDLTRSRVFDPTSSQGYDRLWSYHRGPSHAPEPRLGRIRGR